MPSEITPFDVLQKGYRRMLREAWGKAWKEKGWKALPRLVIGTVGFTVGYFFLVLWDGVQGWVALIKGEK